MYIQVPILSMFHIDYLGWSHLKSWTKQDMLNVPVLYILGAFIPATMIAVLYYFDHSVASQLAQQKEFNLRKPPSFHYDLLLLGFLVSFISHLIFRSMWKPLENRGWCPFNSWFLLSDSAMRPPWNSPIKWCHPPVSNAYKEFGYSQASGKLLCSCILHSDTVISLGDGGYVPVYQIKNEQRTLKYKHTNIIRRCMYK